MVQTQIKCRTTRHLIKDFSLFASKYRNFCNKFYK